MNHLINSLIAVVLGAALVLGFAPFDYWWAYVAALVAFVLLIQYKSPLQAAWLGLLLGVGQFGVGTSWVYVSVHNFSPASAGTAGGITALLVLYQALFISLACWAYARLAHRYLKKSAHHQPIIPALLLFASLWLLAEIPRSHLLNGFPWLLTGYAFFTTPLTGWGKLGGISATGSSGMLIVVLLSFVIQRAPLLSMPTIKLRCFMALIAIALILVAGGALRDTLRWRPLSEQSQRFALIQGNIAQEQKWQSSQRQRISAHYQQLMEQAWQRSDLIILPEAALPYYLDQNYDWYQSWHRRALDANKSIIIGALSRDSEGQNYNSVIALGANSELAERIYHKHILVPFGEYVPLPPALRRLVHHLAPFTIRAGAGDQAPLPSSAGALAPLVCYEVAFDAYSARQARDASVIITISNDAWFGRSIGPQQHAQIARMRAIENEMYLLRATNTGLTFAADPSGQIISSIEPWQSGIAYGEYHPALSGSPSTPFSRVGLWPIYLLILLCAGFSFLALRQTKVIS